MYEKQLVVMEKAASNTRIGSKKPYDNRATLQMRYALCFRCSGSDL
jgi:hypothetical protein